MVSDDDPFVILYFSKSVLGGKQPLKICQMSGSWTRRPFMPATPRRAAPSSSFRLPRRNEAQIIDWTEFSSEKLLFNNGESHSHTLTHTTSHWSNYGSVFDFVGDQRSDRKNIFRSNYGRRAEEEEGEEEEKETFQRKRERREGKSEEASDTRSCQKAKQSTE